MYHVDGIVDPDSNRERGVDGRDERVGDVLQCHGTQHRNEYGHFRTPPRIPGRAGGRHPEEEGEAQDPVLAVCRCARPFLQ